jgi:hypothetical protein
MNSPEKLPHESSTQNGETPFWSSPWGYPHAVLVGSSLFLNGWLIQTLTRAPRLQSPPWPFNFYLLATLWCVLFVIAWMWRKTPYVRWLSSIPVSVVSLAFVGALSLLTGLIPQGGEHWVTRITESWPFAIMLLFMLVNLGLATLNKLFQFTWKNWGFVANHAGFWIVIAGMAFGSSDIEKLRLMVAEGESSAQAVRLENNVPKGAIELPFSVRLKEFRMDEYHPRIAFYDSRTTDFKMEVLSSQLEVGGRIRHKDLEIEITRVIPAALRTPQGFENSTEKFSEFALYAKVKDIKNQEVIKEGWLAPGTTGLSPVTIHSTAGIFVLLDPQAKLYRSSVEILPAGEKPFGTNIEVNKPVNVAGWKIYQSSYEVSASRKKFISVFDLVRDPWLPVVYAGAFLMLLGTCHLFWNGIQKKSNLGEEQVP